jgi:hypothetical protein
MVNSRTRWAISLSHAICGLSECPFPSPIPLPFKKEYSFKVQVPGSGGTEDMITIGKSDIDMADYVDDQLCVQNRTLMMQFKVSQLE